jgi:hypothetical protein
MKKQRISTYIIALLTLSSLMIPIGASAQENKVLTDEEWKEMPLYQGTMVSIDVAGVAGKVLGSDIMSTEAAISVNLKNRFFPIAEIGYGSINTTNDETDIHYKTSAPYFRLGMDYNVFYRKPYLPGYFTVGLRYGFTSFDYDVQAPSLTDPNWGGISIPVDYKGVKTNVGWTELVAGVKAHVFKGFYIGFTARYRARLSMSKHENSEPYYIPGFGKGKNNFALTYNLIYKLPF